MTWQAWVVVVIVVLGMGLFASEKLRIDLVALMILVALMVSGIISPSEAFSGFSNEATVTVAAMFALSIGIERTGVLEPLGRVLMRIQKPWLLTLMLMLSIALLGAFIKNIALVALFLPLAMRVCSQTGTAPGRVLMPMAYAAQMGGVATLIGTSSNLLTDSLARQHGLAGFGIFEFTGMALILTAAGMTYLMLFGRWLLPQNSQSSQIGAVNTGKYLAELKVTAESGLVGQTLEQANLAREYGVYGLELIRGEQRLQAPRQQQVAAEDILLIRGNWPNLAEFCNQTGLKYAAMADHPRRAGDTHLLAEVMVAPDSPAEGRVLGQTDPACLPGMAVLAIHRRGQLLRQKLQDTTLAVGDVLLMALTRHALGKMRGSDAYIVLGERDDDQRSVGKAIVAAAIMIGVVAVSGLRLLPIPVAATTGAVAMALTGCFGYRDVYEGMDWKIIILLAAILPLGIAIEKTGLSQELVAMAMQLVGEHNPWLALLMVYLLTALMTELMGHNPSVVLMVGIAVNVAHSVQANPEPFVVAVAFAAATSFATPVGYPTNTMVYYAGNYRFTDFMKVGIPLIGLFCALSMWLIPVFWPL